jgi:hypothetical protein
METTAATPQTRLCRITHTTCTGLRILSLMALTLTLMSLTDVQGAAPPPVAPGETFGHQTHCFNMTPYEDELMLQVAQVAPASVKFYVGGVQWWGNGHYFIEAAGDGRVQDKRIDFSAVFFNHTPFGGGNRWGRFAASLHWPTLRGPWSLAITGDGRPGGEGSGTPYGIVGFLEPKPCSQLGTVPRGDPPNLALSPSK